MKYTTESFIQKAREIHGDKYDYSKVDYKTSSEKICIICPEHGEFWQTPQCHLAGAKCQKCAHQSYPDTTSSFIEKARKVHNDKYDYSKVEYVNSHTNVCIICPEHGEFQQLPTNHLRGKGCPKCMAEKLASLNRSNTEEFIKKSKLVHGNKYDYSKVDYVNNITKVCIICPEHGKFWQAPCDHLSGAGCHLCRASRLERETRVFLEEHGVKYEHETSLGFLGRQHLDFYIPSYNIGIECQGEQHLVREMKYKYSKRSLADQIKLDERKYNLCTENGVKLLYLVDEYVLKRCEDLPRFYGDNIFTNLNELYKKWSVKTNHRP